MKLYLYIAYNIKELTWNESMTSIYNFKLSDS